MSLTFLRPALGVTLISVLLMGPQFTQAQSQSSISVGSIQYTLTDLDPNDGIAPSLAWNSGSSTSSLRVSAQTGTDGQKSATPIFKNIVNQTDRVSGPLGTNTGLSLQNHQASSNLNGLSASASTPLGASWYDQAEFKGGFTLSAQTAVTFTAQVQGAVALNLPSNAYFTKSGGSAPSNGYFDWSYIQANADAIISFADLSGVRVSTAEDYGMNVWLQSNSSGSAAKQKTINATWSNATSEASSHDVTIRASLDGYTVASIPEASTWAQMLLGLAGLTGLRQQRRRAAERI